MESPGSTNLTQNRCEKLRWKGMYIQAESDPAVQHSNDQAFWCQHTYTCLGPDDKVAGESECHPARGCYEEL